MKPARFSYEAPPTLDAALTSLATWRDDAKIIAGGQSLAPMLNMRLARPDHLIDINAPDPAWSHRRRQRPAVDRRARCGTIQLTATRW